MGSFEIIYQYTNHVEAELAKNILTSNGIEAVIRSDDCGGMHGGQTFVRGVGLLVPAEKTKEAKGLLNLD